MRSAGKFFAFFAIPDENQDFAFFAVKKKPFRCIRILMVIFLLCQTTFAFCQEETLSETIVRVAEEMVSEDTESGEAELYVERLHELAENPVHINSSDAEEISRLFFLTGFQVKALMDYVRVSGSLVSVYELVNIPGFDRATAESIIPFITLHTGTTGGPLISSLRNSLLTNFSLRSSNIDEAAPGSPWKFLTKYKFTTGRLSGGFVLEKDPGEKFLTGHPPLPDFFSANLSYSGQGLIRKIIIGDFSARFGQGTAVNTGFRIAIPLTNPGFIAGRDEIRPYTSSDENSFFRGIAAEASIKKIGIVVFGSRNKIDARVSSSSATDDGFIENFQTSGLHNTEALLSGKDAVTETGFGVNLSYNLRNTRIGIVWSGNSFSLPVIPASSKPEDLHDFEGYRNSVYSIYYNHLFRRVIFSGEYSLDHYLGQAFVQAFSLRPSDRLTINILYREYGPEYFSFHAKGPGSSSATKNVKGIYGSFTFEMAKHLFLSAGFDTEHYPWLRYRCSAPSLGKRQEVRLKYMPFNNLTLEGIYAYRKSMVNKTGENGIPQQAENSYSTLKGVIVWSPSETLTLRTRIDSKSTGSSQSRGMLFLQDVNCRLKSIPLTFWFRFCVFNTGGWESRLWTYENDLLYSFSIPALYDRGTRSYLMLKWKIKEHADLRVKYGITTKIGNAGQPGNTEEIKLQLVVRI